MTLDYPFMSRSAIFPVLLISALHLSSRGTTLALVPSLPIGHASVVGLTEATLTSRPFSSTGKCLSNRYEYDYDELMQSPGEASRFGRRDVMDHERWLRHRSSDRFFRSLSTISESAVLRNLLDEVGYVTLACIGVIAWNEMFIDGYADFGNIHHPPPLEKWNVPVLKLPSLPFELASSALGLLLVFRANNTYDRWLSANANWSAMVSACRSILSMATTYDYDPDTLTKQQQQDRQRSTRKLSVFVAAFPRVLSKHLQQKFDPDDKFVSDMTSLLKDYPRQCQSLLKARNPPLRSIYDLQKAAADLHHLDTSTKISIGEKIDKLSDCAAECDAIYTGPVPRSYTHHTTRFLTIYLLLLPLALYDTLGCNWNHIGAVSATAMISFLFFGIEEIAAILEEPFTIMPLERFTEDVRLSAEELIEWMHQDEALDIDQVPGTDSNGVRPVNVLSFNYQNDKRKIVRNRRKKSTE